MKKIDPYSLNMIPTQDLLAELRSRTIEEVILCAFYDNDPETPAKIKFFMGGDLGERLKLLKLVDYILGEEFISSSNLYPEPE